MGFPGYATRIGIPRKHPTLEAMDVIIVGGGIGGLALAAGLQRRGAKVVIIEQAPALREVGAGISLWPNATRALERLGLSSVVGTLQRLRTFPPNGGFFTPRGRRITDSSPQQIEHQGRSLMVVLHRARLIEALAAEVSADDVVLGARVVEVATERDHAHVQLEDGRRFTGHVVLGADGIGSKTRQQIDPNATPRSTGVTSWRGIVRRSTAGYRLEDPVWGLYVGDGREVGMLPLADDEMYWFVTHRVPPGQPAGELAGTPAASHRDDVLHVLKRWCEPVRRCVESTAADAVLRADLFDLPPLTRWYRDRIGLLGDAAHATSPHLGMGAAMALEDAAWLANTYAAGADVATWLSDYQAARKARTERVISESRRAARMLHLQHPLLVGLRDLALRWMPESMRVRQLSWLLNYDVAARSLAR